MSKETIRYHLRAALDEVISDEKASLRQKFAEEDADAAARAKMLQPVIEALESLKAEVGVHEWLDISLESHRATIELTRKSSTSSHSLEVSTNEENSAFEITEKYWCDIPDYCSVKHHEFSSPEEALKLVVDAVGKGIAIEQVITERLK